MVAQLKSVTQTHTPVNVSTGINPNCSGFHLVVFFSLSSKADGSSSEWIKQNNKLSAYPQSDHDLIGEFSASP